MKKIRFISLICIFIMLFTFSAFAEENTDSIDSTENITKRVSQEKENPGWTDKLQVQLKYANKINFKCEGRFESGFPFNNFTYGVLTEDQQKMLYDLLVQLDATLEEVSKEEFLANTSKRYDNLVDFEFIHPNYEKIRFRSKGIYGYNNFEDLYYFKYTDFEKSMEIIEEITSEVFNQDKTGERFEFKTLPRWTVDYDIDNPLNGINLGVRFGIPTGAITNSEFKADGNITEEQYYTKETKPHNNNEDEEEETEDTEKEETVEKAPEAEKENNETAAEKLESLGLLKGTDKGIELEKEFNRAEAATMLVRLSGKEAEVTELRQATNEFSDMENHWAADYVSYCHEQGITKGTSETTYSPENNITAREYLTLVMRLMGYTEAEPETVDELAKTYIITDEAKLKEILSGSFTRDKMAYISFALLTSETTDGEILINELIATGAVDSSKAAEIFN